MEQTHTPKDPRDEFIQVGSDRWSFVTARSHQRFVPFGANLVLTNKEDLNIFGPRYSDDRYQRILDACHSLGLNILKVFLPLGSLLPDPQTTSEARFAPGYLDNLESFLVLCHQRHIRVVLCLSEWGGHSLRWWQDGGQYFGRRPWRTDDGPDSLTTLNHAWTRLATRLSDNPTVFSYTPCAEWSMPSGNLTPPWAPPEEEIGLVPGEIALWYWRRWALARHGSMDALNRAWGSRYAGPDDIPIVNYAYDLSRHAYVDAPARILDYQNFREWASMRYLRPQLAAIKAADPNHMVTISNHMRSWNLWEGAAKHFLGYTPAEQTPYIDYMTLHANYAEGEMSNSRTPEQVVHEMEALARFSHAGRPMPLIIEEFTYATPDPQRTAKAQETLVRGTIGHASGWMTWYLQFPDGAEGASTADTPHRMAWLNDDLTPTPWGLTARRLSGELARTDLRRRPARRTVRLDRNTELAPTRLGTLTAQFLNYDNLVHPADYRVSSERTLSLSLPGDRPARAPRLRCQPVISGNLRPFDAQMTASQWETELDDERAIGHDLLWLSHITPVLDGTASGDMVRFVLDACHRRGMRVLLDTGSTHNWYGTLDVEDETANVGRWIDAIGQRYGRHPAFWGWYIPHEIYMCWDRMDAYIQQLYPALVQRCKQALPTKPVTLSPFFILDNQQVFGQFRYAEPDEYGKYWQRLIRRSGFDVIMLQDSGEHFSYVTSAQRRPFLEAMRTACQRAGARYWINVETAEFDCPSIEEYVNRYGRVHHSTVPNAPWRAVPIDRLADKLRLAAEYAERIVSWGYVQFGRPSLSPDAANWYGDYQRYQRTVRSARTSARSQQR